MWPKTPSVIIWTVGCCDVSQYWRVIILLLFKYCPYESAVHLVIKLIHVLCVLWCSKFEIWKLSHSLSHLVCFQGFQWKCWVLPSCVQSRTDCLLCSMEEGMEKLPKFSWTIFRASFSMSWPTVRRRNCTWSMPSWQLTSEYQFNSSLAFVHWLVPIIILRITYGHFGFSLF